MGFESFLAARLSELHDDIVSEYAAATDSTQRLSIQSHANASNRSSKAKKRVRVSTKELERLSLREVPEHPFLEDNSYDGGNGFGEHSLAKEERFPMPAYNEPRTLSSPLPSPPAGVLRLQNLPSLPQGWHPPKNWRPAVCDEVPLSPTPLGAADVMVECLSFKEGDGDEDQNYISISSARLSDRCLQATQNRTSSSGAYSGDSGRVSVVASKVPSNLHSVPSKSPSNTIRFVLSDIWNEAYSNGEGLYKTFTLGHKRRTELEKATRLTACDLFFAALMLEPDGRIRTVWSTASITLLLFDIVNIPMQIFMGLQSNAVISAMEWISRVFWSMDMVLSFFTGVDDGFSFEMRASKVLKIYFRTWFTLDCFLVVADWTSAYSERQQTKADAERLLPLLRVLRLLRLLRLLRVAKLQKYVSDLIMVAPEGVIVCADLVKNLFSMCVMIHIMACVWYGIGSNGKWGWVKASDHLDDATFAFRYFVSVHWMATHMHGTTSFPPTKSSEYSFSICALFVGFVMMAIFIGETAIVVNALKDIRKVEMQQFARKYLRMRRVSMSLQIRLNKHLSKASGRRGFKEEVEHETEILNSLPACIRMDLYEETRKPLLAKVPFFGDMMTSNRRLLRSICFHAVSGVIGTPSEHIFVANVLCSRMFCVESGRLTYLLGRCQELMGNLSSGRNSTSTVDIQAGASCRHSLVHRVVRASMATKTRELFPGDVALSRGSHLSEAGLWTTWHHVGELVVDSDATLLAVEVKDFSRVVSQDDGHAWLAVQYARRFLTLLNELFDGDGLSDVLNDADFEIDCQKLGRQGPSQISFSVEEEYFLFLSHYKTEAGTEATLMQEALQDLIDKNPQHSANHLDNSVFLDSSDLTDLTNLKDKVRCSHNLVVLLTPKVFTRPWCLIEIVTAIRSNVNIVPVEIQRPGLKFQYPDEEFYEGLTLGRGLSKQDIELLKEEQIELSDAVKGIRQVFMKIAVPFSPHKSLKIRSAELEDIIERCVWRGETDPCSGANRRIRMSMAVSSRKSAYAGRNSNPMKSSNSGA